MIQVTDSIILKPLSIDDAETISKLFDMEDVIEFINSVLPTDNKQFIICFESEPVGLIGFRDTDLANMKTEIGYWLSQNAQGKGIITQSATAILKYAFDEMGINRVQIRAEIENIKSRNIPERLGFSFEGIQREGEMSPDRNFLNVAVYSLLKKEFKQKL